MMIKSRIFLIKKLNLMAKINYNVDTVEWRKKFPLFKKYISRSVNKTLNIINKDDFINTSVSFLLTSNRNIQKINYKYRKRNNPTNVLSFPMRIFFEGTNLLGDIVLSSETLLIESGELKITKYDYLCKMTIHGMLHLLEYDHKTERQFKEMKKLEDQIFYKMKQDKW